MALVDCHVEGCPSHLHRICQGECVLLKYIDFEIGGRKIYCDCVDKLGREGKSDKMKKVGYFTAYGTIELEEDEEKVEGEVLGGGGD